MERLPRKTKAENNSTSSCSSPSSALLLSSPSSTMSTTPKKEKYTLFKPTDGTSSCRDLAVYACSALSNVPFCSEYGQPLRGGWLVNEGGHQHTGTTRSRSRSTVTFVRTAVTFLLVEPFVSSQTLGRDLYPPRLAPSLPHHL